MTNFDLVNIATSDKTIDKIDVWLGKENYLEVYVKEDIYKIIKKAQKIIKSNNKLFGPVEAPIKKDQVVGKLKVIYNQENIGEYDLLAKTDIKKVNIFTRLMKSLNYLIWGDV